MTTESRDELIKTLRIQIVEALNLEDVTPEEIHPAEPLFGDGLGLDSIDALELSVMLEKNYGIRIENLKEGRKAFTSVEALALFIEKERAGQSAE